MRATLRALSNCYFGSWLMFWNSSGSVKTVSGRKESEVGWPRDKRVDAPCSRINSAIFS